MSEWVEFELKEATTKIGSGATPRGGQEAYKNEGISLIRSQNILDFSFKYSGLAFIDDEQAFKLKNVTVEEDDILINITGDSVARVTKVPSNVLPARVNQHVSILRTDNTKLDSDYLLYYLLSNPIKRLLLKIASDGATRNALTKTELEDIVISAPKEISEQKQIAKTISNLDQKIAILREQNETLEELAQTLFKRWFVDFEFPYDFEKGEISENGKPYKSSGGKMIESELGEIPLGWRVGTLSETLELTGGGTPKTSTKEYWDGDICWYSVVDAPIDSDCFVINTDKKITKLGLEKSSTKILKERTTIISARGTVGKLAITGFPMAMNQSCYGVNGITGYGDFYTYFQLKYTLKLLKSRVHGAVFDTITKSTFNGIETLIAPHTTLSLFEIIIIPIMEKIFTNVNEIQTLKKLRDTLLPKLMSGELKVEM